MVQKKNNIPAKNIQKEVTELMRIENAGGEELSKLQKQFNNYIRKIDTLKKDITEVEKQLQEARKRVNEDIIPLEKQMIEIKVNYVKLLDKYYNEKGFTASYKKKMAYLICEKSFDLIEQFGKEELKEIYEKYNDKSFEEENAERDKMTGEAMKNMFEQMFGIELDEEADLSSPEKFQEELNRKMQAEQEAFEQKRSERKKTKAQLEKENKKKEEEKNISQASRKVYMELVKEFHPDREKDAAERERKTEIMKQVTNAYESNDLFHLLRLQLEFFQIDKEHINKLADEKLKYFNKILREQVQDLESELYSLKGFGMFGGNNLYQRFCGPPALMNSKFAHEKKFLSRLIAGMTAELAMFQDADVLKAHLKDFRIPKNEAVFMRGGF
jgi:hypothetical protein